MDYRRSIGFVIAGYSLDASASGGTAWCWGEVPTGSTDYDWFRSLTSPPESVGIEVNPITHDFEGAAFGFSLAFDDDEAECLLYQQRRAEYVIDRDRSASAAQIRIVDNLTDDNSITTLSDTVVHVGDEAILLGTYNASLFSSTGGYGCTRGYYSTPAQPHSEGDFVYHQAPNRIRHREVLLVLYDHDNETESVVWRGFVDSMRSNSDGTQLTFATLDLYSTLQNVEINTLARNRGQGIYRIPDLNFANTATDSFGGAFLGSDVFKSGEADPKVAVQLDDSFFVYYDLDISTNLISNSQRPPGWEVPTAIEDSNIESFTVQGNQAERLKKAYELFAIDYDADASLMNEDGTATGSMTTAGFSATRELEYPFHPAAVTLAFLLSTTSPTASQSDYDVLNGEWSLRLDSGAVDVASFEAIIAKYPTYRIERMLLGWDGKPVNIWEVIREYCLKPFGLFLGTNDEGQLLLAEYVSQLGIDDFYTSTDLTPVPDILEYQAARSSTVDSVVGIVGQTPWFDGVRLTVSSATGLSKNSNRNRLFAESRVAEYLIPYGPIDSLPRENARAFALLQARAAGGAFAVPRVVVRVPDPDIDSLSYDIGEAVNISNLDIEDAWLVDQSGTRVLLDGTGNISATGFIIGRQHEVETNTYVLTLLLQGNVTEQLIRLRAPSAEVSADSGGTSTTITVTQNAFHDAANDTSYFTVGDEIVVSSARGDYQVGSVEITAVTATTITVDTAVETFTGNVVRLADYDSYANTAVISGAGDNVYFYLSRDGATLGSGGDDPHRYG